MAKKVKKVKSKRRRRAKGDKPRVTAMEANANRSPFLQRLWLAMKRKGILPRTLSEEAGLSVSYVHDLFSGRNERPSYEALEAIAHVLEINVAFLRDGEDHAGAHPVPTRVIGTMPVLGVAETGAFRNIMQSNDDHTVVRPTSSVYPHAKHFVVIVNDDAMSLANEGPFLPGMELLCIDMASVNIEVESGRVYVIRRTFDGGKTYETILRRAMVVRGETHLVAESRRERLYEKIVVPGRLGTDDRTNVYAHGFVYGTFREVK